VAVEEEASKATVETIIAPSSTDTAQAGVPMFVGHFAEQSSRWDDMMTFLPKVAQVTGGGVYRINCTEDEDKPSDGVTECHKAVATAALDYWGDVPGTYIDFEDNCEPTLRADYSLITSSSNRLLAMPQWQFVHLSRFPAPSGLVDPHSCAETPFGEWGGNIYRKLYGTLELAQAMLCHTDFAALITSADYTFSQPYDNQLSDSMLHVVYPSIFQRRQDEEGGDAEASFFFSGSFGVGMRSALFTPWIYTTVDFLNSKGSWILCLILPVLVIACLTSDLVVSFWCFVAGFVVCWAFGFR